MPEAAETKIAGVFLITVGGLWLALTGLCTVGVSSDHMFAGVWPLGLWFMSFGVVPLAFGLRSLIPLRVLGWGLSLAGGAWLACGVLLAAPSVVSAAHGGGDGVFAGVAVVMWLIFQAPGAGMLWAGVANLRVARGTAAPRSASTFD